MVRNRHSSIHPYIHVDGGGVCDHYPHPTTSNDRTPDPHTATTTSTTDTHYYYYRYNFLSLCIVMWLSVLACAVRVPCGGSGMVSGIVVECG
jgi:hypothetical protein